MKPENQKAIWVIGFPKSGNTWISYLCSYCFNLPFHNFGDANANQKKSWIRDLTGGDNDWTTIKGYNTVQKTHKQPNQVPSSTGLVIYAIRDPRDVFVSYYYFMRSSNAQWIGRLRFYLLGIFGRKTQIKSFLSSWKQHINAWSQQTQMIMCYDKLISNGPEYLSSQFSTAGFAIDDEIVYSAFEQFSFEKMSGGRKPGLEDQKSFFRKGISGDWQNQLTAAEVELFGDSVNLYQESIN